MMSLPKELEQKIEEAMKDGPAAVVAALEKAGFKQISITAQAPEDTDDVDGDTEEDAEEAAEEDAEEGADKDDDTDEHEGPVSMESLREKALARILGGM